MFVILPLVALFSLKAVGQSELDESTDGYFDDAPATMPGPLPGTFEGRCDSYFRMYHLNTICEFVVDTGHHYDRMAVFSDKAKDEKKAYEMAYDRMKQSKSDKAGLSGAAQGDLDSFMTKAQVSKAIATMCKKAYNLCQKDWCKGPTEITKCAPLSAGQAQFDKDAQQNLQSAFKSAETVKQATGQPQQ